MEAKILKLLTCPPTNEGIGMMTRLRDIENMSSIHKTKAQVNA